MALVDQVSIIERARALYRNEHWLCGPLGLWFNSGHKVQCQCHLIEIGECLRDAARWMVEHGEYEDVRYVAEVRYIVYASVERDGVGGRHGCIYGNNCAKLRDAKKKEA